MERRAAEYDGLKARVNELERLYEESKERRRENVAEIERLKTRVLSAAGDDLCRLTQEEIKQYTSGAVQIPPKEEFMASCERFHKQIADSAGVLPGCATLAQMIAENERLRSEGFTISVWTRERANKVIYEDSNRTPYLEYLSPEVYDNDHRFMVDGHFTVEELKAVAFLAEYHPEDLK